jgi:hypothetical protein
MWDTIWDWINNHPEVATLIFGIISAVGTASWVLCKHWLERRDRRTALEREFRVQDFKGLRRRFCNDSALI